jgi:hypothetical protein
MNISNEYVDTQKKIIAKKEVHYSIYRMLSRLIGECNILSEIFGNLSDSDSDIRRKIFAINKINDVLRFARALGDYKKAYGEYPDFSQWIDHELREVRKRHGRTGGIDIFISDMAEMESAKQKLLGDMVRNKKIEPLFGPDFIKAAEKIRLREEL